MKYLLSTVVLFSILSINNQLLGQVTPPDTTKVIQFSGIVVTQDQYGELVPLPYTAVAVAGTARGTYAEVDGFFSLVAQVGDTIVFSRLGFQTVKHAVPDIEDSKFYSWYQVMSQDDILLPEAVIYPWPSRDHYKIEFLALDVSDDLRRKAEANLAAEVLDRMRSEVAPDGANAFEMEKAERFAEMKYDGQFKPQKIFDVVAWGEFVKAWKRGDFKKKNKK